MTSRLERWPHTTLLTVLTTVLLGATLSGSAPGTTPEPSGPPATEPTRPLGAPMLARSHPRLEPDPPGASSRAGPSGGSGHPVGTAAWRLSRPADKRQIEGYADRVSGVPGTTVGLRISTGSRWFRVTAYRIGAYRDGIGLRVWASGRLRGHRQPGPTLEPAATRTVRAPWRTSLRVHTAGWPEGFYLFKLVSSHRWQAYVPYVVRSPVLAGKVVLSAPVATWQAYNDWGGYSLYAGPPDDRRAWAVSFDRPYPAPGADEMLFGVVPVAVEAERAGVPLAYVADTDLDADVSGDPDVLKGARAFVSLGHDEYWSWGMRATVTRARDSGVNLAFLGANTMYWQIRLARVTRRGARTVVGYRTDAAVDPARTKDPARVTKQWRRSAVAAPENAVTGMQYECFPVDAPFRVVSPHWWGFHGTHVRLGTKFRHLVGVEADRAYPVRTTPRPLQVLSQASYDCWGVPTSTTSTYYTTRSGSGVFDVGTLRWTCALRGSCPPYTMPERTVRFTRQVTRNVFRVFAAGPAGRAHPAVDNLRRFHLSPVNLVPAS
jgi:hypothetical protein